MKSRHTRLRHSAEERLDVHPDADREKISALVADMVQAFQDGDLDTYRKLDEELRWLLRQGKKRMGD